jgi:hypothetical protein
MKRQTEKTLAYVIVATLFAIGVVCYAAFPERKPDEPVRIMLKSTAGKVLFDHKLHTGEDGYGIDCIDCHHAWDEDPEVKPVSCTECHEVDSEDPIKRSEALHQLCIGCHEDDGTAPTDCSQCHIL